jgi:hypothetical protein
MKVPCLPWLQGPWSPAGYDVVELTDETAPADAPLDRQETHKKPWSPLGYQVVEQTPAPDSEARGQRTKDTRARKRAPARRRRTALGQILAFGGACLAALLLVLGLVGSAVQARPVPPAAPLAPVAMLPAPVVPQGVCPANCQGPAEENFGTAVEFERNAGEAGRSAEKQHKLLFLLHVSGNFEDAGFT